MPFNDYFIFDGEKSTDYGLYMASDPNAIHPARRGELFPIPGRNGSIVREDGSYDTYTLTYDVLLDSNMISTDVYAHAREVAAWLLGSRGFCRLEDSYEPEYFRLARCAAQMSVENRLARFGRAQIPFEVQPQRYLKIGETPISYEGDSTTSFSIKNPTQFEARPLLKFVDTAVTPGFVPQTLTMREDIYIDPSGVILEPPDPSLLGRYETSTPVSVVGKTNAMVTCNGYAFLDSNGDTRRNGFVYTGGVSYVGVKLVVPSWAASIVVSNEQGETTVLELQDPRPNPGVAAVTINGTTVNLDFSAHDTIYLDCDLHDAYYIDGSNANAAVSFASNITDYPTFPGLAPGENTVIVRDGDNLDFSIVPRWWEL